MKKATPVSAAKNSSCAKLVQIRDEKAVTTSLQVAKVFGKDHFHVLETIRSLECSKDFIASNFGLYHYFSKLNENVTRKLPMYYLTRDGFTFLVMGFTGKVAAKFKEDYITAFNRMEETLRRSQDAAHDLNAVLKKILSTPLTQERIKALSQSTGYYEQAFCTPGLFYEVNDSQTPEQNIARIVPKLYEDALTGLAGQIDRDVERQGRIIAERVWERIKGMM